MGISKTAGYKELEVVSCFFFVCCVQNSKSTLVHSPTYLDFGFFRLDFGIWILNFGNFFILAFSRGSVACT